MLERDERTSPTDASHGRAGGAQGSAPLLRTTVIIGDADTDARQRTRESLQFGGLDVVADVDDAQALIDAVRRHRPRLCLIDVALPGGGFQSIARVRATSPGSLVVVLTESTADHDVLGAVRAGAAGYLLKDTDPVRLPLALHGVLTGEAAIPRTLMSLVMRSYGRSDAGEGVVATVGAELTARQRQVLELLRYELTTAEIAECLFVSTGTVRTHIAAIVHKLGVPDREAVTRLLGNSLGDAPLDATHESRPNELSGADPSHSVVFGPP